jgi:transcriptional regulator with AAA-type ATPase domain
MKKKNRHIGSSLDEFLKEEGILEETRAAALKEAIAWQVQKAMKRANINKVQMARRMNTSRAALDRLLDPGNASVQRSWNHSSAVRQLLSLAVPLSQC